MDYSDNVDQYMLAPILRNDMSHDSLRDDVNMKSPFKNNSEASPNKFNYHRPNYPPNNVD